MEVIKKSSPNFTVGREGKKISGVIIHWIGQGTVDSTIAWFASTKSKVSAHYLVSNNDKVYQFVEEKDTAWQAGDWNTNLESIGIEHDAIPGRPLTEQGYKTSGELVRGICLRHNIPIDREHIMKHSEIKATQCPGTVDIDKIISYAKKSYEVTDWEKKYKVLLDENKTLLVAFSDVKTVLEEANKKIEELKGFISTNKTPLTEFTFKELTEELFKRLIGGGKK
jgi:N-acetyl-anhydromuramyl-L-alanine amidase AmpD